MCDWSIPRCLLEQLRSVLDACAHCTSLSKCTWKYLHAYVVLFFIIGKRQCSHNLIMPWYIKILCQNLRYVIEGTLEVNRTRNPFEMWNRSKVLCNSYRIQKNFFSNNPKVAELISGINSAASEDSKNVLPKEARVVICGGGVMGGAVAYHLSLVGLGPQTVLVESGRWVFLQNMMFHQNKYRMKEYIFM